jgi:hypothetical protein
MSPKTSKGEDENNKIQAVDESSKEIPRASSRKLKVGSSKRLKVEAE